MRLSLTKAFFFASLLAPSIAVPTTESHSPQNSPQPPRKGYSFTGLVPSIRPLRLQCLFEKVVDRVYPLPKKTKNGREHVFAQYTASADFQTKYGDFVVLRFAISTDEEAREFAKAAQELYFDIWDATDDWVDVKLSKSKLQVVLASLPESLQHAQPLVVDVAKAVANTYPSAKPNSHGAPHDLFFEDFQPLSVLFPWLRMIAAMHPDLAQLTSIGHSYEGREIPALRLGIKPDDNDPHKDEPRHTMVITGGGHAREWISVSTIAYMIHSLIYDRATDRNPVVQKILTHYDIVFIPIINPDGYEYTWTTDRLWRKNRQKTGLPFCSGIDLDRSFPFGWDGDSQADNPCSENYAGRHPLQAVEAKVLADWAKNETGKGDRLFTAFVDLHSYSQQILYPYSYSCDHHPSNLEDLEEVALAVAKSFRLTTGHHYSVSSACKGTVTVSTANSSNQSEPQSETKSSGRSRILMSDESGGSALDYFYQDLDIKYSFQIKLRDTGSYGFLLPRSNIIPTGQEAYEGLIGLGRWLLGNRGIEKVEQFDDDDEVDDDRERRLSDDKPQPVEGDGQGGEADKDDRKTGEQDAKEEGQPLWMTWWDLRRR